MPGSDFAAALASLDKVLTSIESVIDPDKLRAEVAQLQIEVAAPDLWDDPDNAQRVTSRLSGLQSDVDRLTNLRQRLDDVSVLVELGQEESDDRAGGDADAGGGCAFFCGWEGAL